MEDKYVLNQQVGIYDNGMEICFYWSEDAKGTILRGMGVDMFRAMRQHVGEQPFTVEELQQADLSIDRDFWQGMLNSLLDKQILVKDTGVTQPDPSDRVGMLTLGLTGSRSLIAKALPTFVNMGFRYFVLEGDIEGLGALPSGTELQIHQRFTESDIQRCDLVLLLDQTSDIQKHRHLNTITTGLNVPFLSARIYGQMFEVGPLVLPGHCACFECYWQRIQTGSAEGVPQWVLEQAASQTGKASNPYKEATINIALQYAALECVRFATSRQVPLSVGHVISQDVSQGKTRIPAILEVPGCQSCKAAGGVRKR